MNKAKPFIEKAAEKLTSAATTILENRANVRQYEKIAKMCLGIAVIIFMVSFSEPPESNIKNVTLKDTIYMILEGFTSNAVLVDFLKREGVIVLIVSSLLYFTRRYNAYLDEVELKLDLEEFEAKKKAKLL